MLFALIRMEFNTERNFLGCKTLHNVARFGVPQLDISVIGGRQELCALIVECNIFDSLPMPVIRAYASPIFVHFPQFYATIHAARQQQMWRFRYQPNSRNAFRVARPGVNVRFGQETAIRMRMRTQIHTNIMWCMQEWTTLIVQCIFDYRKFKENGKMVLGILYKVHEMWTKAKCLWTSQANTYCVIRISLRPVYPRAIDCGDSVLPISRRAQLFVVRSAVPPILHSHICPMALESLRYPRACRFSPAFASFSVWAPRIQFDRLCHTLPVHRRQTIDHRCRWHWSTGLTQSRTYGMSVADSRNWNRKCAPFPQNRTKCYVGHVVVRSD